MLNVLLESRAPRTRRVGSTVTSALVHATLIAGAVALTMPGDVHPNGIEKTPPPIKYVTLPHRDPLPPAAPAAPSVPRPSTGPSAVTVIVPPDFTPPVLPPIEVGPPVPPDQISIGGPGSRIGSPIGGGGPLLGAGGAAVDERYVDRAPTLFGGAPEPRYPASLRAAGVEGRVLVQFVVDTLGRAELDGLEVVETAHPQFAESVRAVLARYRFSVGEAGGRKVRTRVQMPFVFSLTR